MGHFRDHAGSPSPHHHVYKLGSRPIGLKMRLRSYMSYTHGIGMRAKGRRREQRGKRGTTKTHAFILACLHTETLNPPKHIDISTSVSRLSLIWVCKFVHAPN